MAKLILLFSFFILFSKPAYAQNTLVAGNSAVLKAEAKDERVTKLREFLKFYDSPIAPFAETFVVSADTYNIDWKLVAAISGVESTFGKKIPFNSYNAYGWNGGNYRFESWNDSIAYVSKYLAEKYVAKGLDNPVKIGRVYCPPNSQNWARNVSFFMEKLENFSKTGVDSLGLSI